MGIFICCIVSWDNANTNTGLRNYGTLVMNNKQ